MNHQVIQFLQYSLDSEKPPSYVPQTSEEWGQLYHFAHEQTLIGVFFEGIGKLDRYRNNMTEGNRPFQSFLLKWMAEAEQIRRANILLNKVAAKVFAKITGDGIPCCVLKGQGNALLYPSPYTRQPGDIDVWLNASRHDIELYVSSQFVLDADISLQHASAHVDGVCVEFHFVPHQANNPFYAHRLKKYFRQLADEQCRHIVELPDGVGKIAVPTIKFNLVYQLCHLKNHFFGEGLGLRQVVDYYYLLQHALPSDMPDEQLLRKLDLWKFARAMMYVQREALGLETCRMVAPIDEWRGKTLLEEILNSGNFGRYDKRYGNIPNMPKAKKYFVKSWRVLRFVRQYPGESLVEPVFRLYHFVWRVWTNHVKRLFC